MDKAPDLKMFIEYNAALALIEAVSRYNTKAECWLVNHEPMKIGQNPNGRACWPY